MILKVFSVFDSKSQAFARPFFDASKGSAIRAFGDIARDKQHPIGAHPEDYTLFELGEWDDKSAQFTFLKAPVSLGLAIELLPLEVSNG